jgi:hypothetical protein
MEYVRDRFDPAMGVPGEPLEILPGIVRSKIVEKQKRIEHRDFAKGEPPLEVDTGAFDRRPALQDFRDLSSCRHGAPRIKS